MDSKVGLDTGSSARRRGWLLTAALFVAGVVGVGLWVVRFDLTPADLARMDAAPGWLLPATVCLALPFLVHAIRYKFMLDRVVRLSWRFVIDMVLACSFLNHFVVAKIGDFAEPSWIQQRTGLDYWTGLRVGLLRAAHSAVALGVLAGGTLWAWSTYLTEPRLSTWVRMVGAGSALGSVVGFLLAVRWATGRLEAVRADGPAGDAQTTGLHASLEAENPSPGTSPDPAHGPSGSALNRWSNAVVTTVRRGLGDLGRSAADYPLGTHLFLILLAVLEVSLDALPYLFFALAAGIPLGPAPVLTASGALNLIEYIPTPPALLGVQEWAGTLSMLPASVPPESLAVTILVHRTARTLMIALLGTWPAWRILHARRRNPSEALETRSKPVTRPGVAS